MHVRHGAQSDHAAQRQGAQRCEFRLIDLSHAINTIVNEPVKKNLNRILSSLSTGKFKLLNGQNQRSVMDNNE